MIPSGSFHDYDFWSISLFFLYLGNQPGMFKPLSLALHANNRLAEAGGIWQKINSTYPTSVYELLNDIIQWNTMEKYRSMISADSQEVCLVKDPISIR